MNAIKKKKKPTTTTRKTAKNKNKQILITPVKKHIWNSLLDTFKTHFTIESHEKKLNKKKKKFPSIPRNYLQLFKTYGDCSVNQRYAVFSSSLSLL